MRAPECGRQASPLFFDRVEWRLGAGLQRLTDNLKERWWLCRRGDLHDQSDERDGASGHGSTAQYSAPVDVRIDRIDPAYYTVADGDGETTTASDANLDVGRDSGPAAQ
jgi:hypothetical protein